MNKVYIAGKVSGLNYLETYEKFLLAEQKLNRLGFEVVNPMKLVPDPETDWQYAMRKCIKAMVEHCNTIYLLYDWKDSPGARLEYQIANKLGFKLLTDHILHEIEEINTSKN
ncbi:DUF4406 domain-containing protein [Thermophagus sp. OGC60D27]|uniref:DUF4406 domain-containing protein n=1 Tax=Thermophagus sp. OGC60D27 TaxID=3458415 RepID=UPI004037D001